MSQLGAVLWDLDGTLIDSEPAWVAAERRLVEQFGTRPWNHPEDMVGLDLRDAARIIQTRGGVQLGVDEIVTRLLDDVATTLSTSIPWRPGARQLLGDLHAAGVPCALVTMTWSQLAMAIVEALPAGWFRAVVAGDDVTNGKPHPEPYLTAASLLGVPPASCVALEDSPTGVRAALAAGCRTIGIPCVVDLDPQPGLTIRSSLDGLGVDDLRAMVAGPAVVHIDVDEDQYHSPPQGTRISVSRQQPPPRRGGRRVGRRELLVGAGAAAVVGGTAWWLFGHQPTPPKDVPVHAWAPYWGLDRSIDSLRTNAAALTSVSPFWFQVNDETLGAEIVANPKTPADAAAEFVSVARGAGVALFPSIVDATSNGVLASILADPTRRAAHVKAVTAFATSADYAGVDLDYEGFAYVDGRASWPTTRPAFSAFVAELAAALHAAGKQLSVTVPPIYADGSERDKGYWVYDYRELGRHVDQLRIMAYDQSFSQPGPIAALDWIGGVIRAAKRTVSDHSKLILGVPMYGYNWVTSTSGTCPPDAPGKTGVSHSSLNDLLAKRNVRMAVDGSGEGSFTYQLGVPEAAPVCTQERVVQVVTPVGTMRRVDLARRSFMGGASLFSLGGDSPETWSALTPIARPRPA